MSPEYAVALVEAAYDEVRDHHADLTRRLEAEGHLSSAVTQRGIGADELRRIILRRLDKAAQEGV